MRRFLLFLTLFCGLSASAWAQPSFGNAGSATFSAVASVNVSVTCSGSNRWLVAAITRDDGNAFTSLTAVFNTTENMTADGATHTNVSAVLHVFKLTAPTSTTANVAFSWSGNATGVAAAACYSTVDQTTPVDAIQEATGQGSTPSQTVTGATGDLEIQWITGQDGGTNGTPNGTQIERVDANVNTGFPHLVLSEVTGAASQSMGYTLADNPRWIAAAYNVNVAAGAGGTNKQNNCLLLGICE